MQTIIKLADLKECDIEKISAAGGCYILYGN